MKVEYNNLYTHFVFTTQNRMPVILEQYKQRYVSMAAILFCIFSFQARYTQSM